MSQESGSRLAGGLWLTVSHEAAIKRSAGTAVIWRLDWYWRNWFQDGSFPWLLAVPHHVGLSMRLLKYPHLMGARFSQSEWPNIWSHISLCLLYFIGHTDQSWNNVGGGIPEHEYQKAGSLWATGSQLGDWRPQRELCYEYQQLGLKPKYIQERLCHLSFSWTFLNLWDMYWLPFEAMLKKFWTWEPEMSVQILVLDSTFGRGLI